MTYAELIAALAGWLRRPDAEQELPRFVALAEARMNRLLAEAGVTGAVVRAQAVLDEARIGAPDDLALPISLVLAGGASIVNTSGESLDALRACEAALPGQPRYFTVAGGELQLYPAPDKAYEAELTYQAGLGPLGPESSSNWLLARHPDAYLYGALCQAGAYLGDDGRLAAWNAAFAGAIDEVVRAERARRGVREAALRLDPMLPERTFDIRSGD